MLFSSFPDVADVPFDRFRRNMQRRRAATQPRIPRDHGEAHESILAHAAYR